eukprot:s1128_g12.t1
MLPPYVFTPALRSNMEIWALPRYFFYDAWKEMPCNKPEKLLYYRREVFKLENMPPVQSESKSDRIQSATVDSAPAQNDQKSSKHCGNGDADQKAAEDAVAAYALAAKAKLGQGQAPEALLLELLSTVSPAYPLARLSFNLTNLSEMWKFSICRCIVGWVEGWSVEDCQKATTSMAARLLAKVFKFIGKDHPIRRNMSSGYYSRLCRFGSLPCIWQSLKAMNTFFK